MNYATMCSGIEAPTLAWHPLGWIPVFFSEIDPFPCAVLAHHYPGVPNLGDMTKYKDWPDYELDLICGGTPCQSFSVAGLRKGMADPRGNLALTFLAIVDRYRPTWLVWENVPGVLSSNGGRDFGAILGGMVELGYGVAYRVLDAQYFGVPQRRRRVFVVGHLGDWRRAAAVLFERHSLQGHPAPRREAGKGAAGSVAKSLAASDGGIDREDRHTVVPVCMSSGQANAEVSRDVGTTLTTLTTLHEAPIVAGAICKDSFSGGAGGRPEGAADGHYLPVAIQNATRGKDQNGLGIAQPGDPMFTLDQGSQHAVAHALRGEGFDASEDGSGRGTPLVPVYVPEIAATQIARSSRGGGQINSPGYNADSELIAFHGSQDPDVSGDVTHPVGRNQGQETCIAFTTEQTPKFSHDNALTLTKQSPTGGGQPQCVSTSMQVRRLTPRECERLQGFPDDYTLIQVRGKPAADGPRYKALGNSMAVPVVRWIGERIAMVEALP